MSDTIFFIKRRLAMLRPGQRIYVPTQIETGHWITQALGPEDTRKLAEFCGGESIDLPSLRAEKSCKRGIIDADGNINKIARMYGVTYGYAARLRRDAANEVKPPLLDLMEGKECKE